MNGITSRPVSTVRFGSILDELPYGPNGQRPQSTYTESPAPEKTGRGKRIAAGVAAVLALGGAGGGGYYVGQQGGDQLELSNQQLTQERDTLIEQKAGLDEANQQLASEKATLEGSVAETTNKLTEAEAAIADLQAQLEAAKKAAEEAPPPVVEPPVQPPAAEPGDSVPGFDAASFKPVEKQGPKVPANNVMPRGDTTKKPLGVLHETVGSLTSAISHFQNAESGVSSHIIIDRNGEVTLMVDPKVAARGAGHSEFKGESEKYDRPNMPISVNQFSYQIELVSPKDGYGEAATHSGYTDKQLQAAAYYFVKAGIPLDRIIPHKDVALPDGRKADPRSFDTKKFETYYNAIKAAQPEVTIDMGLKSQARPA